jgi:hypothetical protein
VTSPPGAAVRLLRPLVFWNVLNYGQITNAVRVEDARFQERFSATRTRCCARAGGGGRPDQLPAVPEAPDRLEEAAAAAKRSADLALIQYREGATDYTTVITAQAALLAQPRQPGDRPGRCPQGLIEVYRPGGGWELREGKTFLPADLTTAMGERTDGQPFGAGGCAAAEYSAAPDTRLVGGITL